MKEIKLTTGEITLVDDSDYDYLMQWKWYGIKQNNNIIVARYDKENYLFDGRPKNLYMARVIMNTPKTLECDHINKNTLDNQRSNLRNCTHSQNCVNRKQKSTTGYRGVTYDKVNKKYIAQIKILGNKTYLGSFTNVIDAAKAYDDVAKKLFDKFAQLNFKE